MSFEWFVAVRYLTARRRQAFISLISGVSVLGVGVGVMALVIALALMTGLQNELRDRIVGSTAHIYVYKMTGEGFNDFRAATAPMMVDGVVAAAPAMLGKALVTASGNEQAFVNVKGIDVPREQQVTALDHAMVTGRADALVTRPPAALPGIILGADLADSLHVTTGDILHLLQPEGAVSPFGLTPANARFQVVGTFRFGFYEFDSEYALVTLQAAQQFFRKADQFDFVEIRVRDMYRAGAIAGTLQKTLGPAYEVQDWQQMNGSLYSALWLEKMAISLTIALIVMVAALNIVASLVLLVMEKSRDIAILRTMGARAQTIRRIFMLEGLVIGGLGTGLGALLGVAACFVLDRYRLIQLPSDVYQITYLPFTVRPLDLLVVILSGVAVCFVATLYPSRQAGRLDPAEALRYQ